MPGGPFLSRRGRRWAKKVRWRATRRAGSERYTWAALNRLDRQLVALLGEQRGGTFVELGGNDGLQQSNTLALEVLYGWRGLLVEADPELAAECIRNRPDAAVICAAAGADWGMAALTRADLVTTVGPSDAEANADANADAGRGSTDAGTDAGPAPLVVPTAPLSALIDAGLGERPIDLLSLDVEGYELPVLAGLDLARHRPGVMVIETNQAVAVADALGDGYLRGPALSYHDHLFVRADLRSRFDLEPLA